MATLVGLGTTSMLDQAALQEKERKLFGILKSLGKVIVAYSGGTLTRRIWPGPPGGARGERCRDHGGLRVDS
jgi:hypothetical protein